MAVDVLDFIRAEFMANHRPYHVVALHFWIRSVSETWPDAEDVYEAEFSGCRFQTPSEVGDRKLSMIT